MSKLESHLKGARMASRAVAEILAHDIGGSARDRSAEKDAELLAQLAVSAAELYRDLSEAHAIMLARTGRSFPVLCECGRIHHQQGAL